MPHYYLVRVKMVKAFTCGYEREEDPPSRDMILEALMDAIRWEEIDDSFEIEVEHIESFRGKGNIQKLVKAIREAESKNLSS